MSVTSIILQALYYFLPAYIANMAPVLFKNVPFLVMPIWEKKLGKNKTWRGVAAAVLCGIVVFWLQKIAYTAGFTALAIIDYADFSILLGFLLGFGAIIGDAVKSYYKRKAGIEPGERWLGFDQLDFVVGGLIFSFLLYVPPIEVVVVLFLATPFLHIATNHLGYWLGLRKVRF
ncbi:CDP-archaeol synthase [Candidatus Woesearchaeota archaeon]|nr:CDP-archaeol synthase [Candidatus Woesearchaeota archaeon]